MKLSWKSWKPIKIIKNIETTMKPNWKLWQAVNLPWENVKVLFFCVSQAKSFHFSWLACQKSHFDVSGCSFLVNHIGPNWPSWESDDFFTHMENGKLNYSNISFLKSKIVLQMIQVISQPNFETVLHDVGIILLMPFLWPSHMAPPWKMAEKFKMISTIIFYPVQNDVHNKR